MISYVLPTPKFIQESTVQIKHRVQHSITATQAVQAFMICKTGCCNVRVHCQGTAIHTISYKHTQKLLSLLTSIIAAVSESLLHVGKLLALLRSSSQLCRYRSSLVIYSATELYLLPCGRECTVLIPGSITIIVDLHKNIFSSEQWVGPTPTIGKGGPLVVIDRKAKLWLLILQNVGVAIALIQWYWHDFASTVVCMHDAKTHQWHIIFYHPNILVLSTSQHDMISHTAYQCMCKI